ncbi:MAG: hypothetical protein AB4426_15445 [Xenococcaceae cyanobacterium]
MAYWEFLLQKEGDRSWLPMEKPTLEIEEGQYRVVAHSNRTNVDVEIRVTHQATSEGKSLRRSQKRSRRTNSEGLMVIIPFTYLKPGLWELRCCGDIMSDLLGESWQERLQLQVFPKIGTEDREQGTGVSNQQPHFLAELENEGSEKIDTGVGNQQPYSPAEPENEGREEEKPLPQTSPTPISEEEKLLSPTSQSPISNPQTSGNSVPEYFLQELDQLLHQEIEPMLQQLDAPITSPTPEPVMPSDPVDSGLRLTLDRDTFVRCPGESILISGWVDALDNSQFSNLNSVFQGTLRYELRNPQTAQILLYLEQHLPEQTLPLVFSYTLEIPSELETDLILGEVILKASSELPVGKESSGILARQPLSITTDENELLEAVEPPESEPADYPETEDKLSPSSEFLLSEEEAPVPSHLELLEPTKMKKELKHFQPLSGQVLPPKIIRSSSTKKAVKLPPLPKLSHPQPKSKVFLEEPNGEGTGNREQGTGNYLGSHSVMEERNRECYLGANPDSQPAYSAMDSQLVETFPEAAISKIATEAMQLEEEVDSEGEAAPLVNSSASGSNNSPMVTDKSSSSVKNAFQSLNLQERFWLQLNSLAAESESSVWLNSESSSADNSTDFL